MKRNFQNYIKEYGLKVFISKTIRRQFLNSDSWMGQKINNYNEQLITKTLQKIFDEEELDETGLFEAKKHFETPPIWIMWWQGYDQAPELVKACINSVQQKNLDRPVIVLNKNNYTEYMRIPDYILKKQELGYITVTQLSDMIRMVLLYTYGGLWHDATILDVAKIPQEVFNSEFYTIKTGLKTKDPSHGEWTAFFMASQPKNELMKRIAVGHYKFWKQHDELIDYIMVDYIIRMAVQNDKKIAAQIKTVPENNRNVFKLREYLDCHDEWTAEDIKKLKDDTYLFKLSWKDEKIQSKNALKAIKEL